MSIKDCPECNGEGVLKADCPTCGTWDAYEETCETCDGTGEVEDDDEDRG